MEGCEERKGATKATERVGGSEEGGKETNREREPGKEIRGAREQCDRG